MPSEEPEWLAGDPQNNQETYWEAWYKVGNAPAVLVDRYCKTESFAAKKAQDALKEALAKVLELQLQLDGEAWTIKWQTRKQTRKYGKTNKYTLSVAPWGGSLSIVMTSLLRRDPK